MCFEIRGAVLLPLMFLYTGLSAATGLAPASGPGTSLPAKMSTHEDLNRNSLTENPPLSQPPLDIESAVHRALENNQSIRQAREKVEMARYDKGTARAPIFPNLSFVANKGEYKSAVGTFQSTLFGGTPYNQYTANLALSQPLFAFGILSAIRVADYNIELYNIDLEIVERTLTNEVIQSFYQVLLNQRLLEMLERMEGVVRESVATAQQRMRTGRGQLLDVLQVKTQLALLRPQIESAHNNLETSGAQLATWLAEEGKYELRVKGTLKALNMREVEPRMDFQHARLPELERVRLSREQIEEQKDVIEGQHLPSLSLQGNYGALSYTQADLTSGDSLQWSILVQLTVPLFSGLSSIYQRRSLSSQDRQLEFQGHDLENTLALNQVQSLKALQSSSASLVSSEEAADLADQSLKEASRQYRLATIDFVQFLTIEQSDLQAEQSLDQIKYNNIVAFANYFVATGQPLPVLIAILQEKNK